MNNTTGENLPCFVSDLCCNDRAAITLAGFSPLTAVIGDVFHITKRILTSASTLNRPAFGQFAADLRKCFGSTSPGIFWAGEKILLAIYEVKKRYATDEIKVWTQSTTETLEVEKKHIINCLALPKHIDPIIRHRNGKYILQRGTNNCESTWR